MQPVPPGYFFMTNNRNREIKFDFALGDDFQQAGWVHPMGMPPPPLGIPPPIQQVLVETEEEKLRREGGLSTFLLNI